MDLAWLPRLFVKDPLAPLLSRAQAGDEEAFTALYAALYPRVLAFVARRTRSQADAEEVVSRTFHRLVERLREVDAARGVMPFVLRISRNLLVDDARARRQTVDESAAAQLAGDADPLGKLLHDEELRRLRDALSTLDDGDREVLALRFGDELSHGEIASMLELREAAVRKRVSRALERLRARIAVEAERGAVAHGS